MCGELPARVSLQCRNLQLPHLGALRRGLTANQRDQEDTSIAYAVSSDASIMVGASGWKLPLDAFIWLGGKGKMMKLSTYLAERGITGLEKWDLLMAIAITPDGKIIGGIGTNPSGLVESWIVKLQ